MYKAASIILIILSLLAFISFNVNVQQESSKEGHNECLKACKQKLGKDSTLLSDINYK
jgi:hypothetical protein